MREGGKKEKKKKKKKKKRRGNLHGNGEISNSIRRIVNIGGLALKSLWLSNFDDHELRTSGGPVGHTDQGGGGVSSRDLGERVSWRKEKEKK